MSLGNVFLRPQALNRVNASEELRVADEFFELASRLGQDALNEGPAWSKIEGVLQECLDEILQDSQSRVESSAGSVQTWFEPIVTAVNEGIEMTSDVGDADGVVGSIAALINLLAKTSGNLSTDQISQKLNELGDIVENGMGLSQVRLITFLKQWVDRTVDALTADYLAGSQTPGAENSFVIGSRLSSLKKFMQQHSIEVSFEREKLVNDLVTELKKRKWDEYLQKISNLTSQAGNGMQTLSSLFSLISGGSNSRSTGTQDDPMSWYASWFLDDVTSVGDRFQLHNEPFFNQMSFKKLSPEFMEHWAHLSSGIGDLMEATLHGVSIERGDFVSNLVNLLLQAGKGIFTLAAYKHEGEGWLKAFKLIDKLWFEYLIAFGATTLASMEGAYFGGDRHRFIFWLTLLGADVVEAFLYANWTILARESTLSLFTLINADQDTHPNSQNFEKVEGLALLFAEIGSWIAAAISGRKYYGFPLRDGVLRFILYWFAGISIGFLMALIGWFVGWAIAGEHSSNFGSITWKSLLLSLLKWPIYWYLIWDGNTDAGKLGLDQVNNFVIFGGYPDSAQSPYKLPYKKGDAIQCAQGNQGVWSHNVGTRQIYAVDFAHDHGTEVLASRGGTVIAYYDEYPDHSTIDGNYVTVRHDDPAEGLLPDPVHDRDNTGIVATKATYFHGRHFGVRHAFAARGIPESRIVGSKVKQGTVIMYSGDTGMSAYNHLHTWVETSNAPTIPFVYREVRNLIGKDGVPKALNYYVSDNEKTGEIREMALHHPDYHNGSARGGGSNYIDLNNSASEADDEYKDCHIFVESGGVFQYKKILRYDGDSKRATIEGNWNVNPSNGDRFRIGAPPYSSANDFNKIFAYWANDDASNNAVNFNDDRVPYKYATLAAYHPEAHQGTVQTGGGTSDNFITLESGASSTDDEYNGRHIIIKRHGNILQYKEIRDYEGATRKVTIDGTWDISVFTGAGGDHYAIGAPPYSHAAPGDKRYTYLAPDAPNGTYSPANFADGKEPYVYATFGT